jgi:DNA-binding NarL/FixJ family response regulator
VIECQHPNMRLSVLIVDDHEGFRARARSLLEAAGYDVVGEAGDGESALRAIRELAPNVVLLDVQLPDITGFDVARRIHEQSDPPAIILISSREAADYGRNIERSTARGFISKTELSARAVAAILEPDR